MNIIFFFFHWCYNPLWGLAFSVIFFHSALSYRITIFVSLLHSLFRLHSGSPAYITEFFATVKYSRAESSALRPTPNLEDQGISLSLFSQLEPVWLGLPYQKLIFRQHSLLHHSDSQAPPPGLRLRQGGDTSGGGGDCYNYSV